MTFADLFGASLARARRGRRPRIRHEQRATFMGDGCARATGRVGVALATTTAGLTDAAIGPATTCLETGVVAVPRRACPPWRPPTPSSLRFMTG